MVGMKCSTSSKEASSRDRLRAAARYDTSTPRARDRAGLVPLPTRALAITAAVNPDRERKRRQREMAAGRLQSQPSASGAGPDITAGRLPLGLCLSWIRS